MIRCPVCESEDSTLIGRLGVESGRISDQRECDACGERWMLPARSIGEAGGMERIELGSDVGTGFGPGDIDCGLDIDTDSVSAGNSDEP